MLEMPWAQQLACALFLPTAGESAGCDCGSRAVPTLAIVWGPIASHLTPEPLRTLLGSHDLQKKGTWQSPLSAANTCSPHWSGAVTGPEPSPFQTAGAAVGQRAPGVTGRGCSVLLRCSVTTHLLLFFSLGFFCTYFCVYRVSCLCSDCFYSLPRRIWCFINGKFFFKCKLLTQKKK